MTSSLRREEEENILRTRLLYDGHGSGEDKKLVSLIRNITKFCLTEDLNEDVAKQFSIINKDLSAAMHIFERHEKISKMCDKTFIYLEQAIADTEQLIKTLKEDLCRLELEREFIEKLKLVDSHTDCQTSETTMQDYERKKTQLITRMKRHKENLRHLSEACISLQKVLEEDDDVK